MCGLLCGSCALDQSSALGCKLLATESFQGTICSVSERAYLIHKINGTEEPHVQAAQHALDALIASLVPIIQRLHPKDLELLTDLIFRQSGWNRIGVVGGTTKDIDLDLLSAYFSPSWTAFQADRGRYFSVIVDGVSD